MSEEEMRKLQNIVKEAAYGRIGNDLAILEECG